MGDRAGFRASLARFLRFMVPVSCVNALLKYATKELSLGLRERLTAHLQVGGWEGWLTLDGGRTRVTKSSPRPYDPIDPIDQTTPTPTPPNNVTKQ